MRPEAPLDPAAGTRFAALLERRCAGEPVAYLRGAREFWSLELEVSPAVLVPRPETELLVEAALERLPAPTTARIADLGTGSGAIAIALAHERPGARLVAVDASPEALAVAARNAARHVPGRLDLRLGRSADWFAAIATDRFDLIVSNPPYLAADDPALAQLPAEPRTALIAGPRGLEALEAIIAGAGAHLAPGGALLLEHGSGQGVAVADLLAAHGFTDLRTLADAGGHPRLTLGVHPSDTARTRP